MILGLDLSLTSTGAALLKGSKVRDLANFKTTPQDGTDVERAVIIATGLVLWLTGHNTRKLIVAVEDYAHSKNTNVSRLGELGGIVKLQLWTAIGVHPGSIVRANSGTVKKFATGNGHASKEQMVEAAEPYVEDFPVRLTMCDDVCDGVHIARWTREHLRNI